MICTWNVLWNLNRLCKWTARNIALQDVCCWWILKFWEVWLQIHDQKSSNNRSKMSRTQDESNSQVSYPSLALEEFQLGSSKIRKSLWNSNDVNFLSWEWFYLGTKEKKRKFTGVRRHWITKRFECIINIKKKPIYLGIFHNEEDAARWSFEFKALRFFFLSDHWWWIRIRTFKNSKHPNVMTELQ